MKFSVSSYKKTLFIAIAMLFSISQSIFAQTEKPKNLVLYDTQPYHFGFIVGLNQMSYVFDYKDSYQNVMYGFLDDNGETDNVINRVHSNIFDSDTILFHNRSVTPKYKPSFTVGIVGNLRLGKRFDLRLIPSLSFGDKYVDYTYEIIRSKERDVIDWDFEHTSIVHDETKLFVTVIDLPLHIKYKSKRYNNFAAYIIAGCDTRFDLSPLWSDKKMIKSKVFDFAAEIGTGVDFYTHFFKFGIEAKMSFGTLNTLNHKNNQYDSSINGLHNRMFQVSLTFE